MRVTARRRKRTDTRTLVKQNALRGGHLVRVSRDLHTHGTLTRAPVGVTRPTRRVSSCASGLHTHRSFAGAPANDDRPVRPSYVAAQAAVSGGQSVGTTPATRERQFSSTSRHSSAAVS